MDKIYSINWRINEGSTGTSLVIASSVDHAWSKFIKKRNKLIDKWNKEVNSGETPVDSNELAEVELAEVKIIVVADSFIQ